MEATLTSAPQYFSGAFNSQAANLTLRLNRQERQNACFIAAVATFIKTAGSTCFAKPTTILAQYNERSSKFGIKPIQSSTLFTIQKRVIESGALCCELEHDGLKGRNWRRFSFNIAAMCEQFPSVAKQAFARAKCFLARKLECNRSQENTTKKPSNGAGSSTPSQNKNWTISSNQSKDLKKNNKAPTAQFFKSRFKEDCDLAYQLQNAARAGTILASGAKKLLSLHAKHGVHMADSFKSFLMFRIYHGMTQAQQNTRQVVAISAAQHSKNILDNTLRAQARKEREVVKPVSMPAHLSDPKYGTHKYTKLIENIRKSH